ncbi:orotidine-5'-phosphate decarboxylase [Glaciecola punicea ACAM 611]|jgi:orotidine-5'-phosphate decarboxylase|uniref:Orotidine 5'-phosphate decarboxylase n=1 Tax=Glaciecola punicea ACAM 611 TaxID=1121923 RepID=H5T9R8_9ALTE|nr:orotidine-5'-phosphate decarboxylase [Glaciecola punicea]OFA33345.1 orotidine 5'-phosphate decarboxylase [Glaciecola punicea]GAB55045.1 orotidine-5'-phosphate decarboxylase [Glaciecola punicea ACAM 611]
MSNCTSSVIVALDFDNIDSAKLLVKQLSPEHCRLKVGKEMFTMFGPDWVKYLNGQGFDIFLDLKFHDIPSTVAKAVKAAGQMGVWMVNVHASGGKDMIEAAKEAALKSNRPPLLTAVTVLTSMDERQFSEVYDGSDITGKVLSLASLAQHAGADGVVCSAIEANILRSRLSKDFRLVTPGIRPMGSSKDDQNRIMTPAQAMSAGVDYLVIGRPITKALEPALTLAEINASIK